MNPPPSSSHLRLLSDDDLEKELTARDHDDDARHALLAETLRRLSRTKSRPNWVQWTTLGLAFAAVILSAIAAFPVLADLDDRIWFEF